jgi:HSP20 family molecular chaperone IbpA
MIHVDRVEASFENGVLKITLPKAEGARKKSVAIKVK